MQSIQALRERRNTLAKEMKAMVDGNPGRWETALQDKFDAGVAEVADIDAQVKRIEVAAQLAADEASTDSVREVAAKVTDKRDPSVRLFDKWLRKGEDAMSPRTGDRPQHDVDDHDHGRRLHRSLPDLVATHRRDEGIRRHARGGLADSPRPTASRCRSRPRTARRKPASGSRRTPRPRARIRRSARCP
jgi:hypothetical protein